MSVDSSNFKFSINLTLLKFERVLVALYKMTSISIHTVDILVTNPHNDSAIKLKSMDLVRSLSSIRKMYSMFRENTIQQSVDYYSGLYK